jgi:Fe-S cluster assembly ATP-binding protein
MLVTHYQRMLNFVKPDSIHVFMDGKIVKTGGPELALELEEKGYDWLEKEPETTSEALV